MLVRTPDRISNLLVEFQGESFCFPLSSQSSMETVRGEIQNRIQLKGFKLEYYDHHSRVYRLLDEIAQLPKLPTVKLKVKGMNR